MAKGEGAARPTSTEAFTDAEMVELERVARGRMVIMNARVSCIRGTAETPLGAALLISTEDMEGGGLLYHCKLTPFPAPGSKRLGKKGIDLLVPKALDLDPRRLKGDGRGP